MHIDKGDARGVVLAQRKLITTQTDFQRIAHGGIFDHGNFGTRRQTHIEYMLTKGGIVGFNRRDHRVFSNLKSIKSHAVSLTVGNEHASRANQPLERKHLLYAQSPENDFFHRSF